MDAGAEYRSTAARDARALSSQQGQVRARCPSAAVASASPRPGLAGIGYETLGSTFLLAANASTFLVVAVVVRVVVQVRPRGDMDVGGRFWEQAGAGLRVLRRSPAVWVVIGLAAGIVLTTSIKGLAGVQYPPGVTGSEAACGLFVSAWALGSLPGSLVAGP